MEREIMINKDNINEFVNQYRDIDGEVMIVILGKGKEISGVELVIMEKFNENEAQEIDSFKIGDIPTNEIIYKETTLSCHYTPNIKDVDSVVVQCRVADIEEDHSTDWSKGLTIDGFEYPYCQGCGQDICEC